MVKNLQKEKMSKKTRRKDRVRARILGTFKKPRFSVFRSNYHVWCQLINDEKGETISAASDKELPQKLKSKKSKVKIAYEVGKLIAQKARKKEIKEIVFDRDGYKYHGRIKSLADGAREEGLRF